MRTVCQHITLHSLITFHHANMRGSSLRICVPKTFCHPRVMSRSLPHLTLHQHKFSLTYLSYLTVILSYTPKPVVSRSIYILRRFTAELWFLGSPISTGYEPKRIDRNLKVEHQDQTRDRMMGDDCQSPITQDMDEFGKVCVKSLSYNQSLIHPAYDFGRKHCREPDKR